MEENQFILAERLQVIRDIVSKFGLLETGYISFSGGKDSTIVSRLFDMAIPDNKLPRVYIDTGIEYEHIRQFVKSLADKDDRFFIIKPSRNIRKVLEEVGYPFKSKEHSHKVWLYKNGGSEYPSIKRYKNGCSNWDCLPILKCQFRDDYPLKISKFCCDRLKKEPVHDWEERSGRKVPVTGMRREEGGYRSLIGCVLTDKDGCLKKFHPIAKVSEEWEDWFCKTYDVRLCDLYYPPFNFQRTGCKGCPFNPNLQEDLDTLALLLPNERRQCEAIWKRVYDEYRRMKYRLSRQTNIFFQEGK